MKARRYGIWAGLAIVAAITSGALLAQAPQAIGTWVSVGDVSSPLTNGASVALPDNRTLIAGGALADGTLTDAVTIYDSVDDSATAAGTLTSARADHTATLVKDGRVLVVGGMTADGLISSDIEIFDPATGTSAIVALLPEPRNGHVAAALPNGNVLIAGGATVDGAILQTAVLFDPETSGVSSVPGHLHTARVHASATTMLDGRVLVAGGSNGTTELASAEIYDRYSQSFSIAATQMSVGRQGHSAVLLPDNGGVLVAGGTSNGVAQAGVDLFLPAVFPDPFSYGEGEFTATGAMTAARSRAVAGPTSIEGYAFAAAGGAPDAEVYRFATIKTDKDDYAPGELAVITGSGWQPNEEVTLLFQEDPAVHDDYVLKVTANSAGYIYWNQWAPEEHDLNVRFYLTAHDSKSRAQITFTDSRTITSATLNGGSTVTVSPSASITAVVNVTTANGGGNQNWRSTSWRIATSAPGAVICIDHTDHEGSGSYSETFTIAASAAAGTYNAYFIAYTDDLCSSQPSNTLTLTNGVTVVPVDNTKPTVTINSATGDPTKAATIPVSVTFSEPVTGFTLSDLSIGNGTAGNFSGSGATYNLDLTPASDGLVTINLAANAAQDAASNGNEAATQFSRTSDRTAPTISASRSPVANGFGWNNTDVTASYTASDLGSGLDASSPTTGSYTFTAELAGQSHTFTVTDLAGNSASAEVSGINIDKTAPSVTASPSPAANGNGWNNTDVTVTFTGTDALSGIDSCQAPTVLSTEGVGQSASGSCTDKAGNSAPVATASDINIDKTAPAISASRLPAANAFGWNNTDVTASYTATDALSGLSSPDAGSYIFSVEGTGLSHTFTVTDKAGNTAEATIGDVKIDKTAPTVSATPAPVANGNGWNNTDVTVTFIGTDALSGIDSCQAPTVLSTEGAGQSASGSCTDKAGNSAPVAAASDINIDKTAPAISASRLPAANVNGWNNGDVMASYTASDMLSGLGSPATGTFTFTLEGASQSHLFTVIDLAGNSASASVSDVNIDKTAPSVTATPAPAANAAGWNNSDVTVTFTGTDALSGIDSCQAPTVLSTEGAGQSASGSCTDKAGNSAPAATASGINIDKTGPTINASRSPVANAFGWNNTEVTASYSATDALSGLSSPDAGSYIFSVEGTGLSHTFTVTDKAGNTAEATIGDVKIDKTAPTVSATPAPAANTNGWNNTDVTVTFAGTDALSGIDSCQAPTVLSTEGAGQSASGSCTDKAGNSAPAATASGINIDKTGPTINASRSPVANAFGWNNSDVTASYSASDGLSGLDAGSPGTGTFPFNAEGTGQSHTFTVTDLAGNSASAAISDVNIDKTAPAVSATPAPAANTNGWNNTNVTVTFAGTDALSGLDSCQDPAVLSIEGANQSASGSCTDKAGNSAPAASASGINIDKTAPTITGGRLPLANSFGWNNSDVTATYQATDALSGFAGWTYGNGSHTFTAEGAGQSYTFTGTDKAGNSASATVSGINLDKTAPTLAPVVSPNPVILHGTATATPNATDALSGIQNQSCPSVSTGSVGPQSLTCAATDKAGNVGTLAANYSVAYSWQGFLQPINDTAHQIGATQSKFKLGQTVPAKFVLRDAAGVSVQQGSNPAFLISNNLGSCTSYTTLEATEAATPDAVPVYRWDGAQYHFNWSTKGLSGGVYRIYAKLADGNQPWVDICLTK